jgi:hypothetical protein
MFLSADGHSSNWPPSAFSVPEDVRKALAALPSGKPDLRRAAIVPFPAMLDSGAVDYAGRGATESLDAVRALTGLPLPFDREGSLGKEFWAALIRGGYQGAAYIMDCLK